MDSAQTVSGALVGLVISGLLCVLGVLGKRYEGRESRAVSTQATVIDDLESSNKRLRDERDEARNALAREVARRQAAEDYAYELEREAGMPHRRRSDFGKVGS